MVGQKRLVRGGRLALLTILSYSLACDPAPPPPAPSAAPGAACAAHDAPRDLCFICDPELRDEGRLWCREHDRYEDRCWLCHPELEDADRLWCGEHSLYEDECFLCHPELIESRSGSTESGELFCGEHGVAEAECGICHPDLLTGSGGRAVKVRLGSSASAALGGVEVRRPEERTMGEGVSAYAELAFDRNELAEISPLVGGIVRSVEVDLGHRVEAGDLLATITSDAIADAEGAYLRALAEQDLRRKAFERARKLLDGKIASQTDYDEAAAVHDMSAAAAEQARRRLAVLGFDDARIAGLADLRAMSGVLELRAPFAGEIVERKAVRGEAVEAADVLFTVADPSKLWAMVDIPEPGLALVRRGQRVELSVDSIPGKSFSGTLTWLSATVDERTRMGQGRVEVANPDGRLKARMFARALILTARSERSVVVPAAAVQDVSGAAVVFVKQDEDLFEARPVILGAREGGRVEIARGLSPADAVVVAGGFSLKSALLVSRLGAGCVHD